jgi:hypothetical protein
MSNLSPPFCPSHPTHRTLSLLPRSPACAQIVNESFLEDINNMLNSGEVPGMFTQVTFPDWLAAIHAFALLIRWTHLGERA